MKYNYSEREIIDILGGHGKKSIVTMILVLVFAVTVISPFLSSFVTRINVEEKSTEVTTLTATTKKTTEKTVTPTTVVKTVTTTEETTTSPTTTTAIRTTTSPVTTTTEEETVPTRQVETVTESTTKLVPTTSSTTTETTKQSTTKKRPITTTQKSTTEKQITTSVVTTTLPTTMKNITPDIEIETYISGKTDISGETAILTAKTYPTGGDVVYNVYDTNIISFQNGVIIPKSKGTTTISCSYTYNDLTVVEYVTVSTDVYWGGFYETETYEDPNNLKKLVGQRTEYKYYRYLCSSCRYHDWYGFTNCNLAYGCNCQGNFDVLEEQWSEVNPDTLTSHSVKNVPSFIDSNNREWYWCPSYYHNRNETRTIYKYQVGKPFVSTIS